jgi:hypothetical protein
MADVPSFLLPARYPYVRGVDFMEFCDELEANTGYEVDHKQLGDLFKAKVPCKHFTAIHYERLIANVASAY